VDLEPGGGLLWGGGADPGLLSCPGKAGRLCLPAIQRGKGVAGVDGGTKKVLLSGGAEQLIADVRACRAVSKEAVKAKEKVLRYYQSNLSRMQYHTYLEKGYLTGSGAVEAAHRSVVQQRLKLSGQRWSIKGA
jgi:hypothetical protein